MKQTIGQTLRQAREEQRLSLEKASEATHIRVQYLRALEADDLSVLPSSVQARGFLRNYAEYLGLDIDRWVDELRAERGSSDQIIGPADLTPAPAASTNAVLSPQEATPLTRPEPGSASQAESQSEPVPEKTKRRARRTKPERLAEPQLPESAPEPSAQAEIQSESEPVAQDSVALPLEEPQPASGSDSLWQIWLNRLRSRLVSRSKPVQADSGASNLEKADNDTLSPEPESSASQDSASQVETSESTQIFKEIGAALRGRRELLSLHLEEVERNTHVKAHYLEALETGAMENLPSTVQTRGMLSNYATFLDLDVDTLLLRYADALQARHREKNPNKPARQPGQPIVTNLPPIRSFIAGDMIFGIGMAVLLVGFSIWGINRVMMIQDQEEVQPTAPSISDVLLASPDPSSITPSATLLPISAIDEPTATIVIPTQNLNVSVQVNLVAVERTYMRVVVDGEEAFNGRVVPGTAYPFEAEEQVEILVGSGAAIRIVYNGRDLGLLGGLGQVIDNIYTADEIITPTAPPSLTPTQTVPATATTPPPTLTAVPTNTVVP